MEDNKKNATIEKTTKDKSKDKKEMDLVRI
jgi:hypothetical protein